jgi:Na+-transporting NADH:ubiquinone oxidoreductase subunit NqrB
MRPMTFINGVLLGSAGALAMVLGVILFFRWTMLGDPTLDQTVVQSDLPLGELTRDMCIFGVLALLAAAAFIGELRVKRWRLLADWLMSVALVAVVIFFLGEPAARLRDLAVLALAAILCVFIYGIFSRTSWAARLADWLGD